MIPDEAIEAAAWEMCQRDYPWATKFDDVENPSRSSYLVRARAALEVALPFLAEAARQPQRNSPTDWPGIPKAQS